MPDDQWNRTIVRLDKALAMMPRKANGEDVAWGASRVAHLDTGYTEHPALGFANGKSPWIKADLGYDHFADRPDPRDPLGKTEWQEPGHGTRTASCLVGGADGYRGLAPRLPLVPYRVNDNSLIFGRSVEAIGEAIPAAIKRGCQVVAISLGFPVVGDGEMGQGVDLAYDSGVIIVAACGQMTDQVSYPAKHRRVIGVGGFRKAGPIYCKYKRYNRVDIFAPADHILRAETHKGANPHRYGEGDGTSYAVPHVAATAAMWLLHRGTEIAALYKKDHWMKVEAFRKLLRDTQMRPTFKQPEGCLAGMLDAEALLKAKLPKPDALRYEEDLAQDDRV